MTYQQDLFANNPPMIRVYNDRRAALHKSIADTLEAVAKVGRETASDLLSVAQDDVEELLRLEAGERIAGGPDLTIEDVERAAIQEESGVCNEWTRATIERWQVLEDIRIKRESCQ